MYAFRTLLAAALLLPAAAIEHGDTAVAPQTFTTQKPLYIVTPQGAAAGWLQLYVFHPARQNETIEAALTCGVMAILPAGSTVVLRRAARNGGAFALEILSMPSDPANAASAPARHEPTAAEKAGDGQAYALPSYRPTVIECAMPAVGRIFCCSAGDLRAAVSPKDH